MSVSVCIATYNGKAHIREQLDSIFAELGQDDEVLIVDDGSRDGTVALIEGLNDARIRLFRNSENVGHVQAFARAMSLASRDIIMLSDQDDRWNPGRVRMLTQGLLDSGSALVSSNFGLMDASGDALQDPTGPIRASDSRQHLGNIARIFWGTRRYFGCTMAFRRSLNEITLPIPRFVESHDLWLAMAANVLASNVHIEEKSLARRLHERNVSSRRRRTLGPVVKSRLIFAISLGVLIFRSIRRLVRRRVAESGALTKQPRSHGGSEVR